MAMTQDKLMKTLCWSCFEREGGGCFSKDFGDIPRDKKTDLRKGHSITPEFIETCSSKSYLNKREVMRRFFPSDIKLVILSEEALKEKAGKENNAKDENNG